MILDWLIAKKRRNTKCEPGKTAESAGNLSGCLWANAALILGRFIKPPTGVPFQAGQTKSRQSLREMNAPESPHVVVNGFGSQPGWQIQRQ
jgi:hypothetical protein